MKRWDGDGHVNILFIISWLGGKWQAFSGAKTSWYIRSNAWTFWKKWVGEFGTVNCGSLHKSDHWNGGSRKGNGGTTEAFGPGPEWRGKKSIIIGRAMGKRRNGGTVSGVTHSRMDFWSGQVHKYFININIKPCWLVRQINSGWSGISSIFGQGNLYIKVHLYCILMGKALFYKNNYNGENCGEMTMASLLYCMRVEPSICCFMLGKVMSI